MKFPTFSRRSGWELRANTLSQVLAKRREQGQQVLDLTLSNPTRARLAYPPEFWDVLAAAAAPAYAPASLGQAAARQAVGRYYAERGVRMPLERIALTASTSEAYSFLFKLLADPGDQVLIPRPSYPLFDFLAGLEGVEPGSYPLRQIADGWVIDLDQLAAAIGPRTRAIVVVSPNNPTGSYLSAREWAGLEELAAECGLALIIDEVFADYALCSPPPPAWVSRSQVLTFVLSGLSKVLALPQLKLSWISVRGPDAACAQALARLEVIADTYLSVGGAVQEALPQLLPLRQRIQQPIRRRIGDHLEMLADGLRAQEGGRLLRVEGGWYAVVETVPDAEKLALELLERDGVLVHPGFFYDFSGDHYLVLSLLSPDLPAALGPLLDRLRR